MKRRLWIAAFILAMLTGAITLFLRTGEASTATDDQSSIVEVERMPLRSLIESTGRVVSNLDVEIKCKASGQIVSLPFDLSNVVKKGDLLAEIDPSEQLRNVQQAEASLAAANARLAQAEANLIAGEKDLAANRASVSASLRSAEAERVDAESKAKREEELVRAEWSTVEELETARTRSVQAAESVRTAQAQVAGIQATVASLEAKRQEIELNKAQVEAEKIKLSLQNQYLSETKVIAPMDGIVASRDVEVGQIISSGISNVGGGTTIMTISDLSRVFVLASVDESAIGNVVEGQAAEITVDAFPREIMQGKVVRIATRGDNVSNVVTFEVKIEVVSENKSLLKPEMTANVSLLIAERPEAIAVPIGAVARTGLESFVDVCDASGQNVQRTKVEPGIDDGEFMEILSGIEAGDHVLVQEKSSDSKWNSESENKGGMGPPPPMIIMW